jgi:hypothetical protein
VQRGDVEHVKGVEVGVEGMVEHVDAVEESGQDGEVDCYQHRGGGRGGVLRGAWK